MITPQIRFSLALRIFTALFILAQNGYSDVPAPEPHRLNNMVHSLLDVRNPTMDVTYHFRTVGEGFVWIELDASAYSFDQLFVRVNGETAQKAAIHVRDQRFYPKGPNEAMLSLPKGEHTVTVTSNGKGVSELRRLRIHGIPQTHFWVHMEDRPYHRDFDIVSTWGWLSHNVLDKYTHLLVIGRVLVDEEGRDGVAPDIAEWHGKRKKVLSRNSVPGRSKGEPLGEELQELTYNYYKKILDDPLVDGVMADEFLGEHEYHDKMMEDWVIGIRRVMSEFPEKEFHAAMTRAYRPVFDPLIKAAIEMDNIYLAPQHYYTVGDSLEYLYASIQERSIENGLNAFEQKQPGLRKKTSLLFSMASHSPEWTGNSRYDRNFKVVLDTQMYLAATNPAFQDIMGIGFWKNLNVNQEMLRFISDGIRHYFIEGKTQRFYHEPYELTHLQNGSFEDGLAGWSITEAVPGSVSLAEVGKETIFKRLPQRRIPNGDQLLAVKVNAKRPNEFSQQVKNLIPGKRYTVEFFTLNNDRLKERHLHPVSISLEGVHILDQVLEVNTVRRPKAEGEGNVVTVWNHHHITFEAFQPTARLMIRDWKDTTADNTFEGQTILYDFFQVQPYYE